MMNIDFSKQIIHDSARELFRSPGGALSCGETVRLCIAFAEVHPEDVYLMVACGQDTHTVQMYPQDGMWCAAYTVPGEPGVLWYWFCIKLADGAKIYYGARTGQVCGVGTAYWDVPPAYQLTVYDAAFTTPNWLKCANMYQIFPDRFKKRDDGTFERGVAFHRDMGREVYVHESWDEPPLYEALPGKEYYQPCDYYGGNFGGIADSLDYLRDMGVTALYLNPIVEAASNHRYNTGDYKNADPILGTNEDFEELARQAQQHGIRLILDGVYSHTGDDSVYFNKYGHYDSLGAYQSQDSPYYRWYQFDEYPDKYKSWWGFETLPEVNETHDDWVRDIIEGDDSAMEVWLARGACGYRLDVADELPDETIERMRNEIKHLSQDNALIGEVWEDATTKQSYGVNRRYALGRGLDSVMNYPLKNAITDFLLGYSNAQGFKQFLVSQHENYPKEMYYALMNLLSSHDVARMRTVLGTRIDPHSLTREQQAHFIVSDEQDKKGAQLQRLAAAIQFSLPGTPCIYYGDETGMHSLMDPFNREPFHERDEEMQEYYKTLCNLRAKTDALKTGYCVFYRQGEDVLGILRFCLGGEDAFSNVARDGMYLSAVNRSKESHTLVVDLFAQEQLMGAEEQETFRQLEFTGAASLLDEEEYEINAGLLSVTLPPYGVKILEINWI
ncbi:MAG: glycoside hydrolase family 13 protein [Christensenella sp.]|uniref:glycoside hydrolase family 13 protein n=1 Tax=Christensenella sp. TaxID=1935934 RepID=UPI002B1EE830|nr:glycoside hydrolase family 13 protein [Christensenella sp.]MEA5003409.1 glycoside hydrolase family 13 protein [Christensenella sp.]